MSRSVINKHIQTIRTWGVEVLIVPGKGCSLLSPIKFLEAERIRALLEDKRITVLSVVDSTNQYLLDRVCKLQSGDACIAEYQQAGRGRRGRPWVSPFGVNLYLSMFWRLEQEPAAIMGLSLVIGIVMAEVLRHLGAGNVKVKWPNDLYLNDRKLAGILVELTSKTRDAVYLVMGVGINLAMRRANSNTINQDWISLQEAGVSIDRNELAAFLLNEMQHSLRQFESDGFTPFIGRWHSLDNLINRPVKLLISGQQISGIARGVDQQGALLLDHHGVIKPFIGGEISLYTTK